MPSCKDKKKAIPSVFEEIASTTRHNHLVNDVEHQFFVREMIFDVV
jgi:hypothetical protein